jgi:hypothetical protein
MEDKVLRAVVLTQIQMRLHRFNFENGFSFPNWSEDFWILRLILDARSPC